MALLMSTFQRGSPALETLGRVWARRTGSVAAAAHAGRPGRWRRRPDRAPMQIAPINHGP